MTMSNLIEVFRSRLWLILSLPLGAAGIAFFLNSLMQTTYAADATIILDYRIPMEGALAGELLPVGLQPSYLSTQVDIIQSQPVAAEVMKILHPETSNYWKKLYVDEAESDVKFKDWMIGTLLENLSVAVSEESRLIEVWYRAGNPDMAAEVANAFVEAYRRITQQLDRNPALETAQSVEQSLETLREKLQKAQAKVTTYQENVGITASDERLDMETAQLDQLMKQRLDADAALRGTQSRLDALEETMSDPSQSASLPSDVTENQLIRNLQIELAQKESELAEGATSLGSRHPEMRKLRAEVQTLQGKLAAETRQVIDGIRGDMLQARRVANSAAQDEAAQRAKVMKFKHVRDRLQPMLEELDSARASYNRALDMYSEYAMHSSTNQPNISVLKPAQAPLTPLSRNVIRNVGAAFFAGLVFALGLALLLELIDKRVRGKEDISGFGEVEYLGALPRA